MPHSLTPATPTAASPISARSNKVAHVPSSLFLRLRASLQFDQNQQQNIVQRRTLALTLAGAVLGLNVGQQIAVAARRPPPPPPEEKKDPNVSGVTAKVLASKKRKEAMKESMAKLREKGKPIKEPSE